MGILKPDKWRCSATSWHSISAALLSSRWTKETFLHNGDENRERCHSFTPTRHEQFFLHMSPWNAPDINHKEESRYSEMEILGKWEMSSVMPRLSTRYFKDSGCRWRHEKDHSWAGSHDNFNKALDEFSRCHFHNIFLAFHSRKSCAITIWTAIVKVPPSKDRNHS